jgi:7-cyano-7-deazaguanine synthase in queuosine biosynthesis
MLFSEKDFEEFSISAMEKQNMSKVKEITECLDSFPNLDGKKIGLFYSGGLDSQTVAAALLKKGHDVTLITVDNGAYINQDITETAVGYLTKLDVPGKIVNHVTLSSYVLFQEMAIRKIPEDVKTYGVDYTCLGCKLAMLAVAIVHSKTQGITALLDGFVKAQETYPEQTPPFMDYMNRLCLSNGIEHHSPIYNFNSKEKVKYLAVALGVPPRSLDGSCLFEERPIKVDEAAIADYVQRKDKHVKAYISMHAGLAAPK